MLLIFNDVSGSEIFLILFFVLIFFGAKSIPGLARTLGRTIRQIKDASSDLQKEIRKSSDEMKKDMNLKGILEDTAREVSQPLDQQMSEIENTVRYERPRIHSHIPVPEEKAAEEMESVAEEAVIEAAQEPTAEADPFTPVEEKAPEAKKS
jgi:sec-independent protein translocase protein TatA